MKKFFSNLNTQLKENSNSVVWGYVELIVMLLLAVSTILYVICTFSLVHVVIGFTILTDILMYICLTLLNIEGVTSEQRTFRKMMLIQLILILVLIC